MRNLIVFGVNIELYVQNWIYLLFNIMLKYDLDFLSPVINLDNQYIIKRLIYGSHHYHQESL